MDVFKSNSPGILGEDVLLLIFEFLDVKNMCNCEAVCSQWRTVLKSETPWRRLLGRQIALSDLWRQAWQSMGLDDKKLTDVQCRTVCRAVGQYMREMDDNWRTGNLRLTKYDLGNCYYMEKLKMDHNFISCVTTSETDRTSIRIIDKTTMYTTQSYANWDTTDAIFYVSEDIFLMQVPASSSTIQFYERETGQLIYSMDKEPNWTIVESYFSGDLLTVLSGSDFLHQGKYVHRIRIWRVNSSNAICLKELTFIEQPLEPCISGDKFFITVSLSHDKLTFSKPMHLCQFISCKTLEIERSLSCKNWRKMYDGGLFFMGRDDGLVRILDVASGTYLHDIRVKHGPNAWLRRGLKVTTNSKYLVVMDDMGDEDETTFSVYDLQAMRNPMAKSCSILLYTLETTPADDLLIDETRIVFSCLYYDNEIVVIDFGDYDRFKHFWGNCRPSEAPHEEEKCIISVATGYIKQSIEPNSYYHD